LRSQSVLIDKIRATSTSPACSGAPMPKGAPLSAADKQRIIDWVAQGAPQ
jgi:cytochrome c551/c552